MRTTETARSEPTVKTTFFFTDVLVDDVQKVRREIAWFAVDGQ